MRCFLAAGIVWACGCAPLAWAIEAPAAADAGAARRPRAEQAQPPAAEAERSDGRGPVKEAGYLGVTTGVVSEELRTHLDLPADRGLLVTKVVEESPAAKAGLKQHDILLGFNGRDVTSPLEFTDMVDSTGAGKRVTLTILRRGTRQQVHVVLDKRPAGDGGNDQGVAPGGKLPDIAGLPLAIQQQAAAAMAQAMANGGSGGSVQIRTSVTNGTAQSTAISSDDEGTVEIRVLGDRKTVSIRDAAGKEVHAGPLAKEDDFQRIPEAWRGKVRALEGRLRGGANPQGGQLPRGVT